MWSTPPASPAARARSGEIAIARRHLALGYWGRAELTAARLPDDPSVAGRARLPHRRSRPHAARRLPGAAGAAATAGSRSRPARRARRGRGAAPAGCPGSSRLVRRHRTGPPRRGPARRDRVVVAPAGPDRLARSARRSSDRLPAAMVPGDDRRGRCDSLHARRRKLDRRRSSRRRRPARRPRLLRSSWSSRLGGRPRDRGIGVRRRLPRARRRFAGRAEIRRHRGPLGRPLPSVCYAAPTLAPRDGATRVGGSGAPASSASSRGDGRPLVLVHGLPFGADAGRRWCGRLGVRAAVWDARPAGGCRARRRPGAPGTRAGAGGRAGGPPPDRRLLLGAVAGRSGRRLRAGTTTWAAGADRRSTRDFPSLVAPGRPPGPRPSGRIAARRGLGRGGGATAGPARARRSPRLTSARRRAAAARRRCPRRRADGRSASCRDWRGPRRPVRVEAPPVQRRPAGEPSSPISPSGCVRRSRVRGRRLPAGRSRRPPPPGSGGCGPARKTSMWGRAAAMPRASGS